MTSQFDAYARYYDLLYRDKDYAAEVQYLKKLVTGVGGRCESVLELGCGTGRHAELLADGGCMVVGIELSDVMFQGACKRAENRSPFAKGSFCPKRGDVRSYRANQVFDSVFSLFHVVSYQVSNDDVCATFETARIHLASGGHFVFDIWYGPAVLSQRPLVRIRKIQGDGISICRVAEPRLDSRKSVVEVNYTVLLTDVSAALTTICETHVMRYFFEQELKLIAKQNGFELMVVEEWMTGREPSLDTWGVVVVARKI